MKDNIYMDYINNNPDSPESRAKRRKKHKMARVWAFVVFFAVIALIAAGLFFSVKAIINRVSGNISTATNSSDAGNNIIAEVDADSDDIKDTLEDLLGGEAIIAPPEEIVEEPEPEELFETWLDEKISAMPIEERILGLFIVRPEQITGVNTVVQAGEGTRKALV
ncbi:MAG: hypothetical protein MJ107_08615, partial [Lachnospiraceae bacterium]|nr:hypothetical protein [Lachnospiraceae bacterium]